MTEHITALRSPATTQRTPAPLCLGRIWGCSAAHQSSDAAIIANAPTRRLKPTNLVGAQRRLARVPLAFCFTSSHNRSLLGRNRSLGRHRKGSPDEKREPLCNHPLRASESRSKHRLHTRALSFGCQEDASSVSPSTSYPALGVHHALLSRAPVHCTSSLRTPRMDASSFAPYGFYWKES